MQSMFVLSWCAEYISAFMAVAIYPCTTLMQYIVILSFYTPKEIKTDRNSLVGLGPRPLFRQAISIIFICEIESSAPTHS